MGQASKAATSLLAWMEGTLMAVGHTFHVHGEGEVDGQGPEDEAADQARNLTAAQE